MKIFNSLVVTAMLGLSVACSSMPEDKLINIDFINLDKTSDLFSSDFVKDVNYFRFDNDTVAKMGFIKKMMEVDNKLYCQDGGHSSINIFDKDGKFISKVASLGYGKDKYPSIEDFTVDPTTKQVEVISFKTMRLYRYTSTGEFVDGIDHFNAFAFMKKENGNYICFRGIGEDSVASNFRIYEMTPDKQRVKGYLPMEIVPGVSFSEKGFSDSYDNFHKLSFSQFSNEVYRLSADTLKDAYKIDFDTLGIPADIFHGSQPRVFRIMSNSMHYMMHNVLESHDYAYFSIREMGKGSAHNYHVLLNKKNGKISCMQLDTDDWRWKTFASPIALTTQNELIFQINAKEYNEIISKNHPLFKGEPIQDVKHTNLTLVKMKLK